VGESRELFAFLALRGGLRAIDVHERQAVAVGGDEAHRAGLQDEQRAVQKIRVSSPVIAN
jgi:hypothetical protein